jgi:hypothetical protein
MINFLSTVEDEGLDAALALDALKPKPKRKAGRPPKNEPETAADENETGHRAKRTRRSTRGSRSPYKSPRDERRHETFDGVVLTGRKRLSSDSPQPAAEGSHLSDYEADKADVADAIAGEGEGEEPGDTSMTNNNLESTSISHVPDSIGGSQVVPETELSTTGLSEANKSLPTEEDADVEGETTPEHDPNDFSTNLPDDDV